MQAGFPFSQSIENSNPFKGWMVMGRPDMRIISWGILCVYARECVTCPWLRCFPSSGGALLHSWLEECDCRQRLSTPVNARCCQTRKAGKGLNLRWWSRNRFVSTLSREEVGTGPPSRFSPWKEVVGLLQFNRQILRPFSCPKRLGITVQSNHIIMRPGCDWKPECHLLGSRRLASTQPHADKRPSYQCQPCLYAHPR